MKKILSALLMLTMLFALCACGSSAEAAYDKAGIDTPADGETEVDPLLEDLAEQGNVKTEKGVTYVYLTVPEGFAGGNATQKELDAKAGMAYTSATLNKDGSITYKLTTIQHRAMVDSYAASIEKDLLSMIGDGYAFTKIVHNDSFTQFDCTVSTPTVGFTEDVAAFSFYVYGAMYGMFSGRQGETVVVNYYGPNGSLIKTCNSKDM